MLLSEDHRAVQDAVRAYVQDQIAPKAAEWDKSHCFPAEELKGLAALTPADNGRFLNHDGTPLPW